MSVYLLGLFLLNLIIFYKQKKIVKIYNLYDYPDHLRKKHTKPIPLFGGLVIFINILIYCYIEYLGLNNFTFFTQRDEILIFLIFSFLFFLIGYIDDKYSLKPNHKLLLYIILIIFLVILDKDLVISTIDFSFSSQLFNFKSFSIFFTILCFLLFINSLNMLDGINGQTASYSIYISLIFLSFKINLIFFSILIIILIFFLYFNFKNRMFLGDSGTILLGFVISYFFIKSYNTGAQIYSDEIFLIMMIPGFELVRLAIHRLLKKRHPFSPDNEHIHHLILNKVNFLKTYILVQLVLFFPYLFYLLINNSITSLLLSTIIYSFLIVNFQKKKDLI